MHAVKEDFHQRLNQGSDMTNIDSQDPLSDSYTEYNLIAAYYRDIGNHKLLTAEEEQQYSKVIRQGFAAIIHAVCVKYKIEPL